MDKTTVSLPMQGEWIEIFALDPSQAGRGSLPMQGEWIEIPAPVRSSARP